MRKNRINDSSFGGSNLNGRNYTGGVFQAANTLLYIGLGTSAFGLILSGLGTGDKGFQTYALRLMGPALFLSGLLCCLLSVLLCVCPSKCCRRCHKERHIHKNSLKCHINHHKQQPSSERFNHRSLLGDVKGDSKEFKHAEDIPMADQTKRFQKNVNGNNKKTVSIVTTPLETTTISDAPVPSGSSGHVSYHHQKQQHEHHSQQHQKQNPQNDVTSTLLFLQHEQQCSTFTNNFQPPKAPAINIPNFISSSSDEEDILGSAHLLEDCTRKDSNLLDLEMQQFDSSSFDFSSFENSNDKEGILQSGRAHSANASGKYRGYDKRRRTSLNSVCKNSGGTLLTSKAMIETAVICSPSSRIGLINPDPDAHRLEGILLLEEEFQLSSATSKDLHNSPCSVAVSSSSPGRHSDIDNLLQNEIVLSPSKLQQVARKS